MDPEALFSLAVFLVTAVRMRAGWVTPALDNTRLFHESYCWSWNYMRESSVFISTSVRSFTLVGSFHSFFFSHPVSLTVHL